MTSLLDRMLDGAVLSEADERLANVSLHQVWWKRDWIAWMGDPESLENHRPVSHHALVRIVMILLAVGFIVSLSGIPVGTLQVVGIASCGTLLTTAVAVIVCMEIRFIRWIRAHDDRVVLEGFRRPMRLHPASSAPGTLTMLSRAGDPIETFQSVVDAAAGAMRGHRRYGTDRWVYLLELVDEQPLLALRDAATMWRTRNEQWSEEDAWDRDFNDLRLRGRKRREEIRTAGEMAIVAQRLHTASVKASSLRRRLRQPVISAACSKSRRRNLDDLDITAFTLTFSILVVMGAAVTTFAVFAFTSHV